MYANIDGYKSPGTQHNNTVHTNLTNLDKWILSELEIAQAEISKSMDNYQLA